MFRQLYKLHVPIRHMRQADAYGPSRDRPRDGDGQTRDPKTRPYRDRSRHRRGMVTRRVIKAFASIGWGWGGAWTGNTKDYMHFSVNGH